MLRIAYSKAAIRVLRRMPKTERERIQNRIKAYATDPKSSEHDVVKLQGRDGYRMRVGNWRVIFDHDGAVMAIVAIGPRGQIYNR